MGFHNGGYATIWEVTDKGKYTTVKMSTSSKNRDTGTWETDWSDFVSFVGKAHSMVKDSGLKPKDRIKIISGDERNRYDKEAKRTYYNHVIFEFEKVESAGSSSATTTVSNTTTEAAGGADEDPF